jgi:hypothetical protein
MPDANARPAGADRWVPVWPGRRLNAACGGVYIFLKPLSIVLHRDSKVDLQGFMPPLFPARRELFSVRIV